jgi:hypothetical protein
MRVQTSLEFMLIASAIAALSLSVISLYGRSVVLQAGAMGNFLDYNAIQLPRYYPAYYNSSAIAYSASISIGKERMEYDLAPSVAVINITALSHCTNFGFFGGPLDVQGQCGTYGAWEYRADYGRCPSTAAYCFFSSDTGYAVRSIEGSGTPSYDISLSILLDSGIATANLSSSGGEFPLMAGNLTAGRARMLSVSETEAPAQGTIIIHNGSAYVANDATYQQYAHWQSEAYGAMRYYNGSAVDADTQSMIQQKTSALITSSKSLRNLGPVSQCDIEGSEYVCNATGHFAYTILVEMSSPIQEKDLYYSGSTVEIRRG